MDFFMKLADDRVSQDSTLRKVCALIDWQRLAAVLGPVRSRLGRTGYDVDLMIRVLLLGQWHSLSDRELERALTVRLDFMLFCGQSMIERSPDHGARSRLWPRTAPRARRPRSRCPSVSRRIRTPGG